MEELPVCRRCCFCLPLRYGLLTWGYLKMIAAILVLVLLSLTYPYFENNIAAGAGLAVLVLDIVLNILYVIGGHKKSVKLLRVYYLYSIVMWALTVLLAIAFAVLIVATISEAGAWRQILLLLDIISAFISILMQTYFLLLLRSEIIKLRSNCPYRFVKNSAESECTMRIAESVEDKENGTELSYEQETS